jgi:putative membrane protein
LIQFAHFMFFFLCLAASLGKNMIVWRGPVNPAKLAQLRMLDKVTASAAGLLTLSGLAMLFWLAKPSEYYLTSPVFWVKMALFIAASALVIWTKVDFRRAAANGTDWSPPLRIRAILTFDFLGLLILAFLGRSLAFGTAS